MVGELNEITDEEGKFIKWPDILDSAWAALVSNVFVIGHWDDSSILHNKFRCRLDQFLKNTFTDDMDHNPTD